MRILDALRRAIRNTEKIEEVVQGIDNQAKQLARIEAKLGELVELQKAQLVMQRDQADAIDRLAAVLHAAGR